MNAMNGHSTYIRTPIEAKMTISAGNKVFALTLSGVSQEACIDLVTKNWGAGTADFVGLSVGDKTNTFGVMSVGDAVAGCANYGNTISFMFK